MSVFIWIALFVVLIIIEAFTAQLTTIWFAAGAVVAAIASFLNAPEWLEWTLFFSVSFILLLFTRKIAIKLLKTSPKPTNADRALGQNGIVTEEIVNLNAKGSVSLNGTLWTARSLNGETISAGETVKVIRIEGVKLIVEKTNS